MRQLRAWCLRMVGMFGRRRREQELAEELESHLQFHIDDNVRAGMTAEEARRQALIKLGGLEQAKELYRERRGLPWVEYRPMEVKMAVVGYGSAEKKQVQYMVMQLLKLDKMPKPDDAADALAIAVCHAHSAQMQALQSRGR